MEEGFRIAGREIGPNHPPYIIAEMSGNHNGDLQRAFRLLEIARDAGADAVKLQTYTADTITLDVDGEGFTVKSGPWAGRRLYDLYKEGSTPWEWHEEIFRRGEALGLTVFSAPFDPTAVDFLESIDCPAYKIASFEVIDIPLIRKVARTGKPMIISTGTASLGEIEEAVAAARDEGNEQLVLLHCVSSYPAPPEAMNLTTIPALAAALQRPCGLSDHSLGIAVAVTSVALGACVIEKHFTISRAEGGVDSAFSLEPDELTALVEQTRIAHSSLGRPTFGPTEVESQARRSRRSLYVTQDVSAGDLLTEENVRSIRPGNGMAPRHLPDILGLRARRDLVKGTPMDWSLVE